MASNWALPSIVIQYPETGFESNHVAWDENRQFSAIKTKDGTHVKTIRDLLHIARDPKHDILEKTYFLKLTNFNFVNLPNILSGIEVKLTMNRFGRITDDVIQLTHNNDLIGENKADLILDPIKIYGGDNDLWRSNLSIQDISENSFGISLRFESHPKWPHKSSAFIDCVEIRIY